MKKPIILITGSSSGIGFSSMKHFLKKGWNIIAHYYEENKDFDNLCSEEITRCKKIRADFSNTTELESFIDEIDAYSEITALLNCAGCFDFSKKSLVLNFDRIIIKYSFFLKRSCICIVSDILFLLELFF